MLAYNSYKYIVHGRDHLSSWAEVQALKNESAESIGWWLFEEIICCWGCLVEIVTDNGGPFRKAVCWLKQKYGIMGITISSYNLQANSSVECPHWGIRQMLYKACGGDISKWWWFLPHVLWVDHISIRKHLGCSPFFMVTGVHPTIHTFRCDRSNLAHRTTQSCSNRWWAHWIQSMSASKT